MIDLTCKFPFWIFRRCSFQVWALFLLFLCIKKVFGKFGWKLQNDPLDFKISILVLVSQIMVFHFVHFEYKKHFWHILVKFIVHRVSLSSSRSNKKQFQLVDLWTLINSYFGLSRISTSIKQKAWNSGKSQLFPENFV